MAAQPPNLSNLFQGAPNYEPPVSPKRKQGTKRARTNSNVTRRNSNSKATNTPSGKRRARIPQTQVRPIASNEKKVYRAFREQIMKTPTYLINAHSCICKDGALCIGSRSPGANANAPEKSLVYQFEVPEGVYLLSLVTPGAYFCLDQAESILVDESDNLRLLLTIHSEADIVPGETVGKYHRALFSGFRRATGAPAGEEPVRYPNLNFSFNHTDPATGTLVPPEENPYGVYRMDTLPNGYISTLGNTLNNSMSVVKQDADRPGGNWFLSDIVKETLAKEGHSSGIFVLAGCMSPCVKGAAAQKSLDRAAVLMDDAHARFTALKPVITQEEAAQVYKDLSVLPENVGVRYVPEKLTFEEVVDMYVKGITDPELFLTEAGEQFLHPDELERVRVFVEEIRNEEAAATTTRRRSSRSRASVKP